MTRDGTLVVLVVNMRDAVALGGGAPLYRPIDFAGAVTVLFVLVVVDVDVVVVV